MNLLRLRRKKSEKNLRSLVTGLHEELGFHKCVRHHDSRRGAELSDRVCGDWE